MGLIIGIVVAVIMAIIAYKKGFNPVFWILAGGLIGLIVVSVMPSANAAGIEEAERDARRRRGNITGGVLSAIVVVVILIVIVINIR
jgi:chromate transport protein ChrA